MFADFFTEQIFPSLIIPKSSRQVALTIVNAKSTLCAENWAALTGFVIAHAIRNRHRRRFVRTDKRQEEN